MRRHSLNSNIRLARSGQSSWRTEFEEPDDCNCEFEKPSRLGSESVLSFSTIELVREPSDGFSFSLLSLFLFSFTSISFRLLSLAIALPLAMPLAVPLAVL